MKKKAFIETSLKYSNTKYNKAIICNEIKFKRY
ncbi:hypothetical protein KEN51_CDS0158 [Pseudomonas phage vB_Pae10145-KEN51]|nr:hypothetical protein IPCDMZAV_CDS0077 [Pseudomonas phage 6B]WRQ06097.1 hypothetical protein QAMIJHJT_CDS0166 [Pseudomonas phage 9-Ps-8B]WRQ06505.1 hypothetical protein FOPPYZMZ_CDS0165 [Pseudomonas phage 9Ps-7B]WRQ06856.1 hypothetical protein ZBUARNPM_CDS0107 [Pseudomonas phage 14Ps5-6]